MIAISIIKYLFVLFILNQMMNTHASEDQEYVEEILIDTQYVVGNLNLAWNVAHYSQLFGPVQAQFSHKRTSTTWELYLNDNRIYLKRTDNGETVFASIHLTAVAQHKTFQSEKNDKFHCDKSACPYVFFFNLETAQFENDVLILKLTMKILGRLKSTIVTNICERNITLS